MKTIASLLLSATLISASLMASAADEAVMYKKVDKDGNIVFTDKPIPGSKEVKVKTDVNVISRPKPTVLPEPEIEEGDSEDNGDGIYEVLAIDKPDDNEAVKMVGNKVIVIVGISPKLDPAHSLQLYVDGNDRGRPQNSAYFDVYDISKGTHTLKVEVIDNKTEQTIQSSATISFKAY